MDWTLFIALLVCVIAAQTHADLPSVDTLRVRQKDNVTLVCNITNQEDVAWYRLSSDTLTLLISAQKTRTVQSLPVYYKKDKSRYVLLPDSQINTASFTIINLTEEDQGLYFCGVSADPAQMHFGRATRLKFKDEVALCEKVLMYGGVGMAALLLLLTTLVAYTLMQHRKERGCEIKVFGLDKR